MAEVSPASSGELPAITDLGTGDGPLGPEQVVAGLEAAAADAALPTALTPLLALCRNPLAQAREVGEQVSRQPELARTTLELASSALYSYPHRLDRVEHAVLALGFDEVRNLLIAATIGPALFGTATDTRLDLKSLWKHSVGTAIAAEALAARRGGARQADAFLAGLLHVVGKAGLAHFMPEVIRRIREVIRSELCLWQQAEGRVLVEGHAHAGAWLVERWGLPEAVVEPIRHYQAPGARSGPLVHIVHAAEVFARALDLGDAGDPGVAALVPRSWEFCNVSERMLDALFDEILDRHSRAAALIALARRSDR